MIQRFIDVVLNVPISELWKSPLGSQVIADDSDIKPVQQMSPEPLPITSICSFVHDGTWKETDEKLAEITDGILETLPGHAETLNEGTYVSNMDLIFAINDGGKKYELMYTECSRLFCTKQKIDDGAVKL
ncbi:11258_t:CDS:2 [Ambispora leptoticha]|uniref:11258_t:CDS:1 n=1 Tax=Ambispora leptoticha TaxID=144679 RepID=A0A9N8VAI9_9GLOM|nr:11258_t:CDS:2 [Ambispora leptoticha]